MRKFCLVFLSVVLCVDCVNAAIRTQNNSQIVNSSNSSVSRQMKTRSKPVETTGRKTMSRSATENGRKISTKSRTATTKTVVGRTNNKNVARTAQQKTSRVSRAATTANVSTQAFNSDFNSCRDAYFTCMDQFCATQNESYRRCICSSKLKDIQAQEKSLSQTSESLKDFEDFNIDAISKTAQEVKAMGSATAGEAMVKKDDSASATTLKNISDVLNNSKQESLSTKNQLDFTNDLKSFWSKTNLIGGTDIASLTGESLFNAVHSQCSEIVADACKNADFKMVSSSYGIYIENDCAILENNLKNKVTAANAAIRTTRHKMQDTRLENYDAHNSLSINDCISKVRQDITANTACGKGYIHCLDFSGKYINYATGEAIYSPEFFELASQISLSGDVLKNATNSSFVASLNQKRVFAKQNLDLCQDDSDYVWNEFLKQALVEIYQAQQERIKTVKEECLQVVNDCYDTQSKSLKNFTDNSSKINTSQTLVLSEEMCVDKLETCSNLYGGGADGLALLVSTMNTITDIKIEQSCPELLTTFAKNICAVPASDSAHSYPYGCRAYAPGESRYARKSICNAKIATNKSSTSLTPQTNVNFVNYTTMCEQANYKKVYTSCNENYYLATSIQSEATDQDISYNGMYYINGNGEMCAVCPYGYSCPGGTEKPIAINQEADDYCGESYAGSLYQQFVIYALQNCTRDSDVNGTLSESLLAEIDSIVRDIRYAMANNLSIECTDRGGVWVDTPWQDTNYDGIHDTTNDILLKYFYIITDANTLWGYCKDASIEQ